MIDIHVQIHANPQPSSWRHRLGIWLHLLAWHIDHRHYLRIDVLSNYPLPPQGDLMRAMELGLRRTSELIAAAQRIQVEDLAAAAANPSLWGDGRP